MQYLDSAKKYFYIGKKNRCPLLRGFLKGNIPSGPENSVCYREVSAIKCLLYRGSLKANLIGINPFLRTVSAM